MAQYDAQRNRGYYDGYGGRQAAIVGYSATSESYVASSEQVVTMSGYPGRSDLIDQVWPRSSARAKLKKGDEYDHSPRFSHTNGSPHDSPRKTLHRANSPPTGHYAGAYGPHIVSPHDSPRKNFRDNHLGAHGPHIVSPHDSPRKNFRDHRGGFGSNYDDSSDDDECRDGVCYPKPKHDGGRQGYDYDKEKKKTNGYPAGNYPLLHSTDHQPRKDSHHQTSEPHNYYDTEKLPEGGNRSHSYNAPPHKKPATDAYYDRFSNYPASNNYTVPAPIKTRPDHRDAGKFGGDNGRSSPVSAVAEWTPFASSPRKGHQGKPDVIDTTEAQRLYGNAPPQSGSPASRMFGPVIDSKAAARKYDGVFVN